MTRVKGAVLLARRTFAQKEFGEEGWQRVLEELPEGDRALLEGAVLTSTWYPFDVNKRLDEAITAALGDGERDFFESIGASSAQENLSGPHSAFLTPGNPARFMGNTARIYEFYYDTGSREFESTGPSSGVITTREGDTFSGTDCLTVIGWYKEALKMCGATSVEMEEEKCRARGDDVCRYRLSWET